MQADAILPKINALKQYYVRKEELFYFRLCSYVKIDDIFPMENPVQFSV